MHKIILLLLLTTLSLFSMDFQSFKKEILEHSKTLQGNALLQSLSQTENKLLLLTQNPSLNIAMGRYNPQRGDDANGFSAGFSQSIRTSTYYDALKQKASASDASAKAKMLYTKATFIKNIEEMYTKYVYTHKLYQQRQLAYTIAKKISDMAYQQYKYGTKSKTHFLQAQNDALITKTLIASTKLQTKRILAKLQALSGLQGKISLDKAYIYPLTPLKISALNSPTKAIIEAQERSLASQMRISTNRIKNFDIQGELEKEPEQDIARLSLSLPLPLFNHSNKKKELAKLKTMQAKLKNEQILFSESIKAQTLLQSINDLITQYEAFKTLEKRQKHLVTLFQEGYKISKGSLLELLNAKKSWLQSQEMLIKLEKEINLQKIALFYLQGQYND